MKNEEVAKIIEHNINNLTNDWMKAVRADETILSADDLSEGGLRDHVPHVLEEIIEVLRTGKHPDIENTREARVAVYARFRQNYRAQDLAAEISLLRITILDCLSESLFNSKIVLELNDYINATRLIHLYLDEEMRYAFSVFVESAGK